MKTAVAFFIYKRPDCTRRVWAEICKAKPPILLLVADGPKDEADSLKCEATRGIVEQVDWPCDVRRHYAESNMGCRERMASGLTWVFEQVEEAIILEDDCLPVPDFFRFCEAMLERYRDDTRIMHISGNNFQRGRNCGPYSYYFSKYNHNWGWASWRRAWRYYDLYVKTWPEVKASGLLRPLCVSGGEYEFWISMFDRQYRGASNTWDYSWTYACWVQHGLSIIPAANLVSNIGLGGDSTHGQDEKWYMNLPCGKTGDIQPPPVVLRDVIADGRSYREIFQPSVRVVFAETIFNPWWYAVQIRKIPLIGGWWVEWRESAKKRIT